MRVTPQRLAILDALRASRQHPTVEEIHEMVRADHPAISLNTIYKSLDTFEGVGLVHRFVIGDRASYRYDFDTRGHIHHYCRQCGKVSDIHTEDFGAVAESIRGAVPGGCLEVDQIDVHLVGLCSECVDARRENA